MVVWDDPELQARMDAVVFDDTLTSQRKRDRRREWDRANPEKREAINLRWRAKVPERVRGYSRAYYERLKQDQERYAEFLERKRSQYGSRKAQRLEATAAAMREHYLTHGQGCHMRAKAIAGRTA